MKYLILAKEKKIFVNILDGDEAYRVHSKFIYLISLPEYISVKENIYVGDLYNYFEWFNSKFKDNLF